MEYALDQFAREVREAILSSGRIPAAQIELATPKPNIPADLAFPAFRSAKEFGMAPPALAQQLAAAIHPAPDGLIGTIEAAGPFLNFTLNAQRLVAAVLDEVERLGDRYGSDDLGLGRTVVIDYSAPNIAKTMHVGHIRSTIIGQSLYNIFSFLGYRTIGDNHLGDWGTQFGMNIAAILRWGKPDATGEEAIAQIDRIYAEFNRLAKEDAKQRAEAESWVLRLADGDPEAIARREWLEEQKQLFAGPSMADEARTWSLKLEQGDPTARELWQWMVDLTMAANQPNYARLGIRFDHAYGESFYEHMLPDVIKKAIATGVAYRDEKGAVVVGELEKNLPTFLLQRSDGGTLYHTRDVACIQFRVSEFGPSQIIYVVDARQELHFRQLFILARALGEAEGVILEHIKFGTIFDANGQPLSTRKGNMIYLADLLDEAHSRARVIVDRTSPELSEAERDQVAEIVGIGGVIYNDLFQDPRRNITLDWERMLALEGNSSTYIQYMYARCKSILRHAAEAGGEPVAVHAALLDHPAEITLIKQLAKLPGAVRAAAERYAPYVVAEWCYETARSFSGFYHECSVLKAETSHLRAARLRLTEATAQALRNGLALLVIKVPERM